VLTLLAITSTKVQILTQKTLLAAQPPLNQVALDCIWKIMNLPGPTPKTDLCHLVARCGATQRLVVELERSLDESRSRGETREGGGLQYAAAEWVDLSEQHAHRISSILLLFSQVNACKRLLRTPVPIP
jgi:hypothetical protein